MKVMIYACASQELSGFGVMLLRSARLHCRLAMALVSSLNDALLNSESLSLMYATVLACMHCPGLQSSCRWAGASPDAFRALVAAHPAAAEVSLRHWG